MIIPTSRLYLGIAILLSTSTFTGLARAASIDTAHYMVTDFESQMLTTPLNGYWFTYTDRNSSTSIDTIVGNSSLTTFDDYGFPRTDSLGAVLPEVFPKGYNDSSTHGMRFGYVLGNRRLSCGGTCTYDPYVGFGLGFSTLADTVDLTGATGISFWAKADHDSIVINASIGTRDTSATAPDYSQRFIVGAQWKKYTVLLKASPSFLQPGYGPRKPFVASRVKSMGFNINRGQNADTANAITIDDLVIENWKYVQPPDPTGIRAARRPAILPVARLMGREGDGLRLRLPSVAKGRSGLVEGLDAKGRVLGRAAFDSRAGSDVILRLSGYRGRLEALVFRLRME